LAVQPDGKIVAAGLIARASSPGGASAFGLARFNPDGTLDTGFGTGGEVRTDFGGGSAWVLGFAFQRDGKIVVVGDEGSSPLYPDHMALARYNPDGSPDTTFGTGGMVLIGLAGERAGGVAVQADGKVLVAAAPAPDSLDRNVLTFLRFNADGSRDAGFGSGGAVTADFKGASLPHAVAVQGDGKVVVTGESFREGAYAFVTARYNPDGSLDRAFGTGGAVETSFDPGVDGGQSIAVQPDGKIIVGGFASGKLALVRYDADGSLDAAFGAGGTTTAQLQDTYVAMAGVALLPDGRLVVAADGLSEIGAGPDLICLHYAPDGRVEGGFVVGGHAAGGLTPPGDVVFGTGASATPTPGPPGGVPLQPVITFSGSSAVIIGWSYHPPGSGYVPPSSRGPGQVPWESNPILLIPPQSLAGPAGADTASPVTLFRNTAALAPHALIGQGAINPTGTNAGAAPDAGAGRAVGPSQTAESAAAGLLPSYLAPDPSSAAGLSPVGDPQQVGAVPGAVAGLQPRTDSGTAVPIGHDSPDRGAGAPFSPAVQGARREPIRRGSHPPADTVFGLLGGYPEESEDEDFILAAAADDPADAAGEPARPRSSSLWWVSACLVVLLAQHARADRYASFSPPSL
jgi:uncharacterized delta-60 repeat protein